MIIGDQRGGRAFGPTTFKRLQINRRWRQFYRVDVQFHPVLTVLTGVNGSGKTTLLNMLAPHFKWSGEFSGDLSARPYDSNDPNVPPRAARPHDAVTLGYGNGQHSSINLPARPLPGNTAITWSTPQNVRGLHIPSHRLVSRPGAPEMVPSMFASPEVVLENYMSEIRESYGPASFKRPVPFLRMKEGLVAAALYGRQGGDVRTNHDAAKVWKGFSELLATLLPEELNYVGLELRPPDIYIKTRNDAFPLDAASGGVLALFEYAWQIYLTSMGTDTFTVCFDEPENHLHPSLQRSLLPALIKTFPSISFVVATHSPFVVTSVQNSHVYVLEYGDSGVESRLLDRHNKADAAEETLRRVLGVESTLPLWAEDKLAEILSQFERSDLSPASIRALRAALNDTGLDRQFPATLAALAQGGDAER